jgi:hypothetical protein
LQLIRNRKVLILFDLIALIISITWTYCIIKFNTADRSTQDVSIEITPDYQITSGKKINMWSEGTVFEQGRAAYFYAAQPKVSVSPSIKVLGLDQGYIRGTIVSKIELQAVDDKSQVYWSFLIEEKPIQSFDFSKGMAGQADRYLYYLEKIMLNAPAAFEQVTKISKELKFEAGIFQLVYFFTINITGLANEINVSKTFEQSLPINLYQVYFTIPKTQDILTLIPLVQSDFTSGPRSLILLLMENILPVSLVVFFSIMFYILLKEDKLKLSKEKMEHRRFKEWITEGNAEIEVKDRFSIHILNLEGLVDLAIDLDRRVIHDSKINKYYVLTEDMVYYHDPASTNEILDNRQQLGRLLLERGLLQPEQLEIGLFYQKKIGSRLGESLIALDFIDEITLYSTLAAQQKMDYYELNLEKEVSDISWLDRMSLQQARVLMVLPLGERADKKLVIACSEIFKDGIWRELEEIFDTQIHIVVTRPTVIFEVLKRIEMSESQKKGEVNRISKNQDIKPWKRLSEQEWDEFKCSYYRGHIKHELLLKAAGLVKPCINIQKMEQGIDTGCMVKKPDIHGEMTILVEGIEKAAAAMEWKLRQENKLPGLLDLLLKANYLTVETVEWINREYALQNVSILQFIIKNYLASEDTVNNAAFLLETLKSILYRS